jgi:transposase-like protein
MYVKLNGEMFYLWRAVDYEGEILESFDTKTRDKAAALTFIKKALKRHGSPEAITTDGLRSYGQRSTSSAMPRNWRSAAGPTTERRTGICPSDDESEPCCGSAR